MLVRHRTIDPIREGRAYLFLLINGAISTLRDERRVLENHLFPLFLRVHPNLLFGMHLAWEVLLEEKIYLVSARHVNLWDPETNESWDRPELCPHIEPDRM